MLTRPSTITGNSKTITIPSSTVDGCRSSAEPALHARDVSRALARTGYANPRTTQDAVAQQSEATQVGEARPLNFTKLERCQLRKWLLRGGFSTSHTTAKGREVDATSAFLSRRRLHSCRARRERGARA